MKIDIITRHSVPNYGSLLQSYATQKAIEKLGHNSEIINYTRYEERYENLANTLVKGKKWDKNFLLRSIYRIIQTPNYSKMYKTFAKYRIGFLNETKKEYGDIEELKADPPEADVYCSGSDQIWGRIGTTEYDEAYFLGFANGKKRIAYSSSFGKTELSEELEKNLNSMLEPFSKILVREDTAKELLYKKGIKNVDQVLDPTFLLTKNEWADLAKKSHTKIPKEYILVYQLHDNKEFDKYAKKFAKQKNMKLLRISPSLYHISRSGKLVYLPTQYDFIKYFMNASYVLTDSFHATVFSIIFNRKFVNILPKNNTGTRIESVLRLFSIKSRVLKDYENVELIEEKIDYERVNKVLDVERQQSLELFKDAIEN